MDTARTVLTFLMILIAGYFNYMITNVLYTIYKTKKKDKSLKLCLNNNGKIFYIIITIIYVIVFVGSLVATVISILSQNYRILYFAMTALALTALLYSVQIAHIVLVGSKQLLIGRLLVDYRKMKKVDINYHSEMTFVYSQKSFKFPTRWIDVPTLRKSISRRS